MTRLRAVFQAAAATMRVEMGPRGFLLPEEFRLDRWDKALVISTFCLVLFGLLMIYSATSASPTQSAAYLTNQFLRVILGFLAFAAAYRIDYHRWGQLAPLMYLGGLVMLTLVWVPGLGHSAGGARRWINVAGVTLQPSEFARLGLVVYLAYLLSKPKARLVRFTSGIAPCLVAVGLVAVLVYLEPHLSMTLALVAVTALMMVAGRIPGRHLGVYALLMALAGTVKLAMDDGGYQLRRIWQWIDYLLHGGQRLTGNYQLDQSILAIGSGGPFGRGLGESRQKWAFLPELHNDFIYAFVGEELGLIGAVVLIALLLVLLWRAYEAARRAPDRFGSLLATGIGAGIAVNAGINMLVATGLFPSTGLPLPLVSYGGTSVAVTLFSLGILGNISSQGDSSLLVGIGEQE